MATGNSGWVTVTDFKEFFKFEKAHSFFAERVFDLLDR